MMSYPFDGTGDGPASRSSWPKERSVSNVSTQCTSRVSQWDVKSRANETYSGQLSTPMILVFSGNFDASCDRKVPGPQLRSATRDGCFPTLSRVQCLLAPLTSLSESQVGVNIAPFALAASSSNKELPKLLKNSSREFLEADAPSTIFWKASTSSSRTHSLKCRWV